MRLGLAEAKKFKIVMSISVNKYINPKNYLRRIYKIVKDNFFSPLIALYEHRLIERYASQPLKHQPIFIIGAPRTGSTILYQALTNYLDIMYIDNLACRWCNNLFFGMWLSYKKFQNQPHDNFKAEHGNTTRFGDHAPGECGGFWYRWLPKDRHFVDENDFNENVVKEIRKEISAIINYYDKPLVFKNLNTGQRLRLIKQCFPEAKFIFIRRDPRFTVRSILKARKKAKVKKEQWWSVMPPYYQDLLPLPEREMCAGQVFYIDEQIMKDLELFQDKNAMELHHRELSEDCIQRIAEWIGAQKKSGGQLPIFLKDYSNKLELSEQAELNPIIQKYPFDKKMFE